MKTNPWFIVFAFPTLSSAAGAPSAHSGLGSMPYASGTTFRIRAPHATALAVGGI